MPILYHFPTSPFSRRVRLALAHKAVSVELRDARADPAFRAEAARHHPIGTIPVFVDDGGEALEDGSPHVAPCYLHGALGDSRAIVDYLELTRPERPLWPRDRPNAARALHVAQLVDGALDRQIDLATRYWALRGDAAWPGVVAHQLGRAQAALDALGGLVSSPTLAGDAWSAADVWLYSAVAWWEGLPARAADNPNVANLMALGWTLPPALSRWADAHRRRADVLALDAP